MLRRNRHSILLVIVATAFAAVACSDNVVSCHREADAWRTQEKVNLRAHIESLVAKGADKHLALIMLIDKESKYKFPKYPPSIPTPSFEELTEYEATFKRPAGWTDEHVRLDAEYDRQTKLANAQVETDKATLVRLRQELSAVDVLYSQRIKSCSGARSADR